MHLQPFVAPRMKISRGVKHTDELKETLAEFRARVKMAMVPVGHWQDMTEYRLRFSEPPPPLIPIMLGDAIHNFRASLDLLITDVARLRGEKGDNLKYPFAGDEAGLDKILKKEGFPRIGSDVVALIKRTKPYKGGHMFLRALHDLDITDKHKHLVPTYLVAMSRVRMDEQTLDGFMEAFGLDMSRFAGPLSEGSMIRMRNGLNPWMDIEPSPEGPTPCIPAPFPLAGEPVVKVLEGFAQLTTNAVDTFERLLRDGNDPTSSTPSGDGGDIVGG